MLSRRLMISAGAAAGAVAALPASGIAETLKPAEGDLAELGRRALQWLKAERECIAVSTTPACRRATAKFIQAYRVQGEIEEMDEVERAALIRHWQACDAEGATSEAFRDYADALVRRLS